MARCLLLSFHAVTAFPPWMTLPVVPTQWGTEVPSGRTSRRGLRQSHLATSLMLRPRAAGINRNLEKFSKINYCGFCGGDPDPCVAGRRRGSYSGRGRAAWAGIREGYRENSGNDGVPRPHPPAEAGSPRLAHPDGHRQSAHPLYAGRPHRRLGRGRAARLRHRRDHRFRPGLAETQRPGGAAGPAAPTSPRPSLSPNGCGWPTSPATTAAAAATRPAAPSSWPCWTPTAGASAPRCPT